MSVRPNSDRLLVTALAVFLAAACEESTPTGPIISSIQVATTTTGSASDLDQDGYRVTVDEGVGQPIGVNSTVIITGLAAGSHKVELTGVAGNCAVIGANPQTVAVGAETTPAAFDVECAPREIPLPGIAFTRLREDDSPFGLTSDIWVVGTEGASPARLATDAEDPAWSPDGRKIAFSRRPIAVSRRDIWVTDAGGSNPVNLTNDPASDLVDPAWSPDGSRIAFSSDRDGNGTRDIWVMDADGTDPVNLTDFFGTAAFDAFDPAWSPDGSTIAFTELRAGNRDVWIMNADGSNPIRLTDDPAFDGNPAWSPGGSRIAFSSDGDGNGTRDIWVMDADGSNPIRLTDDPAFDGDPAWSPDGSRIAFSSDREGNGNTHIWVMDADGSNPILLTDDPNAEFGPAWSP